MSAALQYSMMVVVLFIAINPPSVIACFGCGYEMPMMGGCCGGMGGWGGMGGFGGFGGFGGMGGWGGGMGMGGCCGGGMDTPDLAPFMDFRLRRLLWQERYGCCRGPPISAADIGCRDRGEPQQRSRPECPTTTIRINCGGCGRSGCQQPLSPSYRRQQNQQPCQNGAQVMPSHSEKVHPIIQNKEQYIDLNKLPPNFLDLLRNAVNTVPNNGNG